ncbi:thiamine phosphate synthase [Pararobbsia silviterrae]|uniref:Thiamine-phosphate synthase n=1 Tax=Pararobbsia silviterrae TaxID=1792498 RepID=A0A494XC67_9BURK|nr:thiamine phosphate synthase [Pararobbsia silviterrae]RKP45724.1 thiamine phosphate synthase [Pararobbsia silviterrae]
MLHTPERVDSEAFWPPADELLEAADDIRASLGSNWPAPARKLRFCLSAPTRPSPTDVRVLIDASAHPDERRAWLEAGAAIIEAAPARVELRTASEVYAWSGERSDDWLAALAAFCACDFALHDALTLALAWRPDAHATGPITDPTADPTADPRANQPADHAAARAIAPGWPVDLATYPAIEGLPAPGRPFPTCPDALGLYPVVPTAEWIERLLERGVRTIQLRTKSTDGRWLDAEIARAVRAARACDARLFINDHWQRAIDAGAYGVHLGQEDLQTADLDAIAAAGLRLGLSTHGPYEMLVALRFRPSYIAMGAVFPTTTKQMPTAPQGLVRLAHYAGLLSGHVPLVAIGGIDLSVIDAVLATGVGSAAVVRAVTEAPDLTAAVDALQAHFGVSD